MLIAEPWDLGPGGYRVGGFPAGWSEWNDRFRDTVRSYWRSDERLIGKLASRLSFSRARRRSCAVARRRPPDRGMQAGCGVLEKWTPRS